MIKIVGMVGVLGIMSINPIFAFDRNAAVTAARSIVNANYTYTYNVVTNIVTAGPTQVGSSNHALPAYQSIAQTIAQIQALKLQLKNFPHN